MRSHKNLIMHLCLRLWDNLFALSVCVAVLIAAIVLTLFEPLFILYRALKGQQHDK